MSIEELMKIRYKVIADYPKNRFGLGEIFTQYHNHSWVNRGSMYGRLMMPDFSKYPHLFRKLEWWEDRAIEDLPQYIKGYDDVFHVKYDFKKDRIYILFKEGGKAELSLRSFLHTSIPATKEEYEATLLQEKIK